MEKQITDKEYSKALEKANQLGAEANEKDINKISRKLNLMRRGPIAKIWGQVEFLWSCIKNAEVPKSTIALITGGLLYLVLPFDIIPDWLPVAGLLDDAAVITYVYKATREVLGAVYKQLEEMAYNEIDKFLQKSFIRMIINSGITFGITVIYVLIKLLQPFHTYSNLIARLVLLANFCWFVVRTVLYWYNYGKYIIPAFKSVIQHKNLRKGLVAYARSYKNFINVAYNALHIVNKVAPEIPDPEEIIDVFIVHYKKRVILALSFIASISVLLCVTKVII